VPNWRISMGMSRLILSVWMAGTLSLLADSTEKVTTDLRGIASDLNNAVRRYNVHLDREIAQYDHASRSKAGRRIPGADFDLMGGPSDLVQMAMRKLFAARIVSARRPGYAPPSLAESDHIQALIVEARSRVEIGSAALRRLQVVSAADLSPRTQAEQKLRLHELLKARNAAIEAAKRAFVALPVALPGADSPDEQRERAWDLMVAKLPVKAAPTHEIAAKLDAILPIRFSEGGRIMLVNEHSCRVTLTDSGREDPLGRRLFYQEEWVKRQGSLARTNGTGPGGIVILFRWAVAVNTRTGQHTLLRSYGPREFRGTLDEIYESAGDDYSAENISSPKPPSPTMQELTAATAALESDRARLGNALADYKRQLRNLLALSAACDADLPVDLRETLFAIRSRMAGVSAIADAESKVRNAADRASDDDHLLEALVAWVNGDALERDFSSLESRTLREALGRSDAEIGVVRSLEREALDALPPPLPENEVQFPALRKDLIVRISRSGASAFRQEVWTVAASDGGAREVKRTVDFIDIKPGSGAQVPAGRVVKHYRLDPGETLEEVYDEFASQAVTQGSGN